MQNILVLNNEWVLGAAIASLLQAEEDLTLFGFTPSSAADLIATLQKNNRLDVLIFDSTMTISLDVRLFLSQLSAKLGIRVIVIDAINNIVHVNGAYDFSIRQPKDLLEIVRYDKSIFSTSYRAEPNRRANQAEKPAYARINAHNKPKHRRPANPIHKYTHKI